MKLSVRDQQTIMGYLRNVAECDPDDRIANTASQLAVDMEYWRNTVDFDSLKPLTQETIRYAIQKRKTYVLKPGAKHACIQSTNPTEQ